MSTKKFLTSPKSAVLKHPQKSFKKQINFGNLGLLSHQQVSIGPPSPVTLSDGLCNVCYELGGGEVIRFLEKCRNDLEAMKKLFENLKAIDN